MIRLAQERIRERPMTLLRKREREREREKERKEIIATMRSPSLYPFYKCNVYSDF